MLAENYIPGVPVIPKAYMEMAKKGFSDYIFIANDGRKAKNYRCTACSRSNRIQFPCRTYTTEDLDLYRTSHNGEAVCPMCNKTVTVKNLGITKKIENLEEVKAIIFVIPKGENDVYFRCEFIHKSFCGLEPKFWNESYEVYHFKKGQDAEYFRCKYWYGQFIRPNTIREPFGMANAGCGFTNYDYSFVGLEKLQKTWLRYSYFCDKSFRVQVNHWFRYLLVYAQYPKMTELLLKFGYSELLEYKAQGKGTRTLCNWNAETPKDFFKLNKSELEEWKKHKNKVGIAKTYMSYFRGKKDGFELARVLVENIGYHEKEAVEYTQKLGIELADLLKYILKADGAFFYWRDYIDAATELKYDLTVHNVIFPKHLIKAHDDAIATRKVVAAKKDNEKVEKRYKELAKKYGIEKDSFLIRPPVSAEEIVQEGNVLKHCVGGYAARHAEGKTNILFMRRVSDPDTPLYTIEIRDKTLIQVHGMSNRTAPKDNPDSDKFFNEWLSAVMNGTLNKKQSASLAEIGA